MASSLALVGWGAGFKYLLIVSKRSLSVVIVGDKIIADELFCGVMGVGTLESG